jgi:hypothetical protein
VRFLPPAQTLSQISSLRKGQPDLGDLRRRWFAAADQAAQGAMAAGAIAERHVGLLGLIEPHRDPGKAGHGVCECFAAAPGWLLLMCCRRILRAFWAS